MFLNILKSHAKHALIFLLAFCIFAPSLGIAANNAAIGVQTVPTSLVAGEPYSITMSFKNTGTTAWTSAAKYCAKLLNPTGWEVTSRCAATTVAINGFLYVNHNGIAPTTPGVYNYQWQMEQQGVGLFGAPSTNFVITVAPRVQNAQFVSHTVPAVLNSGTRTISFTMKNAGNVTWKAGQYALVAQNPAENTTWGISRLNLATATVAPGANGAFTGVITAPATLGYYGMQWRPIEVGKDYIGDPTPPLNLPISGAAPVVNIERPTAGQTFIGSGGFIDVPIKVTATPTGVATISKIEILAYNTANSTIVEIDEVDGPVYEKSLRRAATDQTLYAKATDSFGKFTQLTFKIDTLQDGATVVSHTIPAKMVPNGEYDVTVTMKNSGGTTWTPQGVELITTNPVGNTTYGITSMPLTTTVPPGGTAVFSGRLKAPASEGTVQTQWRLSEKTRTVFGTAVLVSVAIARELPVVTMTTPTNLQAFEPATGTTAQVLVQGSATPGGNATISKLEIMEGAVVLASVNGNSISQSLTLPAGKHPLRLRATDNWGEIGFSPIATISVMANNADYISQSAITTLTAGAPYNYAVTMRNSGSKPWSGGEGYAFAVPDDKIAATWGMPHAVPAGTVAAGGQTTITIPIQAPLVPGAYDIEFQMLQERREWFGERSLKRQINVMPEKPTVSALAAPLAGEKFVAVGGTATVNVQGSAVAGAHASIVKLEVLSYVTVLATADGNQINAAVQLTPGTHNLKLRATDNFGQVVVGTELTLVTVLSNNATYTAVNVPAQMAGGQKYAVSVSMRNSGTSTWTAEEGYKLSAVTPGWENVRIPVPGPIAPNGTAQFDFEVVSPPEMGTYPFQWQMMRDLPNGPEFFGGKTLNKNVAVTAVAPPAIEITWPKAGSTIAGNGISVPVIVGWAGQTYGSATTAKSEILDGSTVIYTSNRPSYALELPFAPGSHTLQARITDSAGNIAQSKPVTFTVAGNQATFVAQSIRPDMIGGERYPVWIKLRNDGTLAWQPGFVLRALSPVDNTTWISNGRIPLNAIVAPGSEYTFAFDVVAPSADGTYNFQWRLENENGQIISADTPKVTVTVGPLVIPTVSFTAAPGNVRVVPGQTATITLTGAASVQGGQISKLELFKDSGAGYEAAPIKVVNGPTANLKINEAISLPGGTYRLKLRATDTSNRTAESAPVLVNITDSEILGVVSGVRSNAAQKLELVGWVCRAGSDESMSYDVYVNAPQRLGGTKVGGGTANIATEPSDTSIRTACGTPASSHHFIASLAEVAAQHPGAKLYVEAKASNGAQIVLPCEDNNCRMPEGMRIGLTSPNATNTDRFRQPSPAFLRAQVTGAIGAIDEVAFHVNGEWIPGVAEGGGAYSISKAGLAPSALPYLTYAKVRLGGTTLITEERKFFVDAGIVPGPVSPTTGTIVGLNRPTILSTEINDALPSGAVVKFFIKKVDLPAPLMLEFGEGEGGGDSGSVIGTATNVGFKWSYTWTPTQAGFYEVKAKLFDENGALQMETPAVTLSVSANPDTGIPDPIIEKPVKTPHLDDGSIDAGTLPGAMTVTTGGSASYSMPLAVPPGTAGMAPTLSLNYASDRANGMLGLGWSLGGMSSIHRCGKTVAQDGVNGRIAFNFEDRLCLDGQRLVLVNKDLSDANYWSDGAEYRTEIESFSRITMSNQITGITFKVESKDGRTTTYGGSTATVHVVYGPVASGAEAPQPTRDGKHGSQYWAIQRVVDRSGNHINYEYEQDLSTGEHTPRYIRYGGSSLPAHAAVEFVFENRPDAWKRYIDESRNDLRQRIKAIRTYVGGNVDSAMTVEGVRRVHEYQLGYEQSPTSGRSMLTSVRACASSPVGGEDACLPQTTFEWGKPSSNKTPGFVSKGFWAGAPVMTTYRADVITGHLTGKHHPEYFAFSDFDRDGYADVLEKRVSSMTKSGADYNPQQPGTFQSKYRYFHNSGSGFVNYTYSLNSGAKFAVLETGDFDGDGALDLLVYSEAGRAEICISPLGKSGVLGEPGSNITFVCDPTRPAFGNNSTMTAPYVADILGEGRAAHFARRSVGFKRCVQHQCDDVATPPSVMGISLTDDGSPEYSYHSYTSFSQMVDFAGVGKPYDVRWSRMNATHYQYDGTEVIKREKAFWQNTTPVLSIVGAGFDDKPVSNYVYPVDFSNASLIPLQIGYKFDEPEQGGILTADFNGSGYNSLAFGYLQFSYPNGVRSYDKAEMTLCLSTGRALDCGVRKKYSGSDYRAVRTIGNFVGDGAPAILAEKISYPVGAPPVPTGELELCRVMGDDTTNGAGTNDTNIACQAMPGLQLPNGPFTNGPGNRVYFMDLMGTGRPQVVLYHSGQIQDNKWHENGQWEVFEPIDLAPEGQALDRIVQVTNGLGATSVVEYADGLPSGLVLNASNNGNVYPIQSVRSAGKMVRRLKTSNGVSADRSMRYTYQDAATDVAGRGSLGFGKHSAVDEQTGITTTTTFYQKWPFTGMVAKVVVEKDGRILTNTESDALAIDVVQAHNGATKFVYVGDSATTRYDWNGALFGEVKTHNEYTADGWANLKLQTVTSKGGGKEFITTTDNRYKGADERSWQIGLVDTVTTTRTAAGIALSRKVRHVYDDVTGLLVGDIIEPGDDKYQVYTYYGRNNAFGVVTFTSQTWIDPVTKLEQKRETTNVYDPHARYVEKVTQKVSNVLNFVEIRTFDGGSGAALSYTDRNSLTTTWIVDGFGRPQKEIRADGNETRTYLKKCLTDCPGGAATARVTELYRENTRVGVPNVVYSDNVGHVLSTKTWGIDGTLIITDNEYDGLGRLDRSYHPRFDGSPAQMSSRFEYDPLNRVVKSINLDEGGRERATTTEYNALVTTRTNARGYSRTETRDMLGQLETVQDAKGKETKFEHDSFGNLTKTTDPNGNVIKVAYDLWGRREMLHDPNLGIIHYKVDPMGRVREQYTARQGESKKTRTEYDVWDRMTARLEPALSENEPGLESHWIYDRAQYGKGQLAEAFTGTPDAMDYVRTHSYDQWGRPSVTMQKIGGTKYQSEVGYDAYGRVEKNRYWRDSEGSKDFSIRYSDTGYPLQVLRGDKVLWEVRAHDAKLRPTAVLFGNGLSQLSSFNAYSGRLAGASLQQGNALRMTEGYDYDEIGSVKTRNLYWATQGFRETFSYDPLNRLESSTIGAQTSSFKYDDVGNLTEKDGAIYGYPKQGDGVARPHAVLSVTGLGSYGYDANGNVSSTPTGRITWTTFDMPKRISKGGTWGEFVYGPEHQRTRQIRSDGSAVAYAGAQEVETKEGLVTVKTYWPNGIGVEIDRPGAAIGEMNWSHKDWLGSPVALSDELGNLREKMAFDAWGKRRNLDGSAAPDTLDGLVDNRGYTGHEMLDQLDLVHMNGRVYDPRLAKFMSGDPLISDPLDGQNYNRYSYVLNNPTNMTDPTGFCAQQEKEKCQTSYSVTGSNIAYKSEEAAASAAQLLGTSVTIVRAPDKKEENNEASTSAKNKPPTSGAGSTGNNGSANTSNSEIKTPSFLDKVKKAVVDWWDVGISGIKNATFEEVADKVLPALPQGNVIGGVGRIGRVAQAADVASEACGCCFPAGTPVSTERGLIPIEQIRVGQLVHARDERSGLTELKPVSMLFVTKGKSLFRLTTRSVAGRHASLEVTDNHPFWVDNVGWVESAQLLPGMVLRDFDNSELSVLELKPLDRTEITFNFSVEDFNTYFAGTQKAFVHNCGCIKAAAALAKTSQPGWIAKDLYSKLSGMVDAGKLPLETLKKFEGALTTMTSGQGGQGIKMLSGAGMKIGDTLYKYELKILGRDGNYRLYGNMGTNGQVVFDQFRKSH